MIQIKINNPIYSQIQGKEGREILLPCLTYKYEWWRSSRFGKKREQGIGHLIDKNGNFLTGFIPRIKTYSQKNSIPLQWIEEIPQERFSPQEPFLPKITFRPDQKTSIATASHVQRGVIKAPTGIGKTVLAMGIISCFPGKKSLFLVNEKTLMEQTYIAMKEQGFQNIGKMGAAQRNLGSQHLVAMSQSFVNLPLDKWSEYFDIIIVDEADVGVSADSRNYKILTQLLAPVRIGVSATLPENEINRLYLEGLLGPVIEEMKIQDGVKLDLLAKPKLRLISVPENSTNQDLTRYSDIYDAKIVNSRTRNRLVINAALEYVDEGKTVLILVTKVEHGKNLSSMGKLIGQDIPFIWGDVDSQERMRLKAGLDKREIKIIVANNVWKRGINVPSLDVLINAAGEKSSSATEQRKGRGLRKFEGKEAAILVDFLDKGKYLADHCIHRLSLYADQGLL